MASSFSLGGSGSTAPTGGPSDFPTISLTPKRETGALQFINKYPQYDGRGTVIVILDTGVDPSADGLEVTSTGDVKVIERYDFSGAGDTDTSTVATVSGDGSNELSFPDGKTFTIPESWDNPSGKFHIGTKPLFDLYCPKLRERMIQKRKEAYWDPLHRLSCAKAVTELNNLINTSSPSPGAGTGAAGTTPNGNSFCTKSVLELATNLISTSSSPSPPSPGTARSGTTPNGNANAATPSPNAAAPIDRWDKEEAEAKVEALDLLEKKYKDWGPILYCFLWEDSNGKWKVVLAQEDDKELESATILSEYTTSHSYLHLTKDSKMTVTVNVWDSGNLLEIVGLCGSHGTHVAAIAAGNFPSNPDLNGVAPGAQIVSITIGDGRLDTMETGLAISRAAGYLQKNAKRVHVVNMSYGEHAHWCNEGRLGELMRETVETYGLVWISSGGNWGPALSTVGTPPWIYGNVLIGVAAYVSPDMMVSEYSIREKLPASIYTWSSRGPGLDGDIGISVCAPGGAITSIPKYTERNSQLMNGTSMAAPHVAGVVALLISASKSRSIPYSPFSIKRALESGASKVEGSDPFSSGSGLVQVEPALEKLILQSTAPERDVRFQITVGTGLNTSRGIYIRNSKGALKDYSVSVEPMFFDAKNMDVDKKIEFRLNLVLSSSVPWVHAPAYLDMCNSSRSFNVKVEHDGLDAGVHYGKIEAFDCKDPARGPIFTLSITVIVPIEFQPPVLEIPSFAYDAGAIKRYFVLSPKGSTSASLTLRNQSSSSPVRLNIHIMTLLHGKSCKTEELEKLFTLAAGEEQIYNFKVYSGRVTEVVICRYWAEPKDRIPVSAKLLYKSIYSDTHELNISAVDSFARLNITPEFQTEEISPTAVLKNQVCLLRSNNMKLTNWSQNPIGRDTFPDGRYMYDLISTYNFVLTKATTVTINCTTVSDMLYENEYEAQLWMIFDSNKRLVGAGDAYPEKWPIKLEKGDYTLKLHLRHEKRDLLEKFMNGYPNFTTESINPVLPVLLSAKLPTNITLTVHQSAYDVLLGRKGTSWNLQCKKGTVNPLFVGTNISDKNMKSVPCSTPTHYFSGTLTLQKDDKRGLPLRLFIPESPPKQKTEKTKEELSEQIREVKIQWMSKVDKEESNKLYQELVAVSPNTLSIYTARISVLEAQLKDTIDEEGINEINKEIGSLIDTVLKQVNKAELLEYFGTKLPDPKLKPQMEKIRNAYVEVMVKKGTLFPEELREAWTQATVFFDPSDQKVFDLTIRDAMERGHYGRAARYILKQLEDGGSGGVADKDKERDKKLIDIFKKLGWDGAIWLWTQNQNYKGAIKDYRLF